MYMYIDVYMCMHITRLHVYALFARAPSSTRRVRERIGREEKESARVQNSEGIKRISTATPVAQGDCTS